MTPDRTDKMVAYFTKTITYSSLERIQIFAISKEGILRSYWIRGLLLNHIDKYKQVCVFSLFILKHVTFVIYAELFILSFGIMAHFSSLCEIITLSFYEIHKIHCFSHFINLTNTQLFYFKHHKN